MQKLFLVKVCYYRPVVVHVVYIAVFCIFLTKCGPLWLYLHSAARLGCLFLNTQMCMLKENCLTMLD